MVYINYLIDAVKYSAILLFIGVFPWIAVAVVMQFISNSIRKSLAKIFGIQGYVYLTFPGVMIHELGHAFFCLVFGHKIEEMKLFSPEEDGTLGYVSHSYNPKNFYQRIGNFFIGTGPVWFGLAALWVIAYLLLPPGIKPENNSLMDGLQNFASVFFSFAFWLRWQSYLWLYLTLTIASHITLSASDLKGAVDGGLIIPAVIFLNFLLLGWHGDWNRTLIEFFKNLFFGSFTFLAFFIILLLGFSIIFKLITRQK